MDNQTHGTGLPFWKYHGTGNDFVMLDNRDGQLTNCITSGLARRLCDRHLGVGGDGLIVLELGGSGSPDDEYDFRMQYFNSDGSAGALCGNGARCAVAFAHDLGVQPSRNGHWRFLDRDQRVLDGFLIGSPATNGVTQIGVRMPDVDLVQVIDISGYFVDTGCPHFVVYVENEAVLDRMDVSTSGSALRHDARFRHTAGTNVDFVCNGADDPDAGVIRVRTFERGVEAETLSCGTGAVAVAVVDLYRKFVSTPKVSVHNVTICACGDACKSADDIVNAANGVIPNHDDMRLCVARTADVIGIEGDATSTSTDVIAHCADVIANSADVCAVGRDVAQAVGVVCVDKTGPLNPGIGRQGRCVRHVESRGGRLTVRVDCRKDQTSGSVVFRDILLEGPTTKVFCGRFF